MKNQTRSTKKTVTVTKVVFVILFVVLALYALIMLSSLLWGLITSLKSSNDFENFGNVIGFPNIGVEGTPYAGIPSGRDALLKKSYSKNSL